MRNFNFQCPRCGKETKQDEVELVHAFRRKGIAEPKKLVVSVALCKDCFADFKDWIGKFGGYIV